jgi:hypothetical protein
MGIRTPTEKYRKEQLRSCKRTNLFRASNMHQPRFGVAIIFSVAILYVSINQRVAPPSLNHASLSHSSRMLDHTAGYILLASVTEQLGKAAFHLNDAFELCVRYNRTCVLPTFQRGQMALEGFELFGELYDLNSLPEALSWVTWGAFVDRLRDAHVDALECSFGSERVGPKERSNAQRVVRFHTGSAQFTVPAGCNLAMSKWPTNQSALHKNLDMVDATLAHSPADVILLHHQDYFQPIPITLLARYALTPGPFLFDRAAALRREIGPYIHLQWRTETAGVNFTRCARCAAESVLRLQRETEIATVYFSADIDLDGLSWSNSVGDANNTLVQEGLRTITSMLPGLKTWKDIPAPRGSFYDLSVIGMLDRTVAMTADVFVSGPPVCARGGTYVSAIDQWRWGQLQLKAAERVLGAIHVRNRNEQWACEM